VNMLNLSTGYFAVELNCSLLCCFL